MVDDSFDINTTIFHKFASGAYLELHFINSAFPQDAQHIMPSAASSPAALILFSIFCSSFVPSTSFLSGSRQGLIDTSAHQYNGSIGGSHISQCSWSPITEVLYLHVEARRRPSLHSTNPATKHPQNQWRGNVSVGDGSRSFSIYWLPCYLLWLVSTSSYRGG